MKGGCNNCSLFPSEASIGKDYLSYSYMDLSSSLPSRFLDSLYSHTNSNHNNSGCSYCQKARFRRPAFLLSCLLIYCAFSVRVQYSAGLSTHTNCARPSKFIQVYSLPENLTTVGWLDRRANYELSHPFFQTLF